MSVDSAGMPHVFWSDETLACAFHHNVSLLTQQNDSTVRTSLNYPKSLIHLSLKTGAANSLR